MANTNKPKPGKKKTAAKRPASKKPSSWPTYKTVGGKRLELQHVFPLKAGAEKLKAFYVKRKKSLKHGSLSVHLASASTARTGKHKGNGRSSNGKYAVYTKYSAK